jgi:isoquinoline 1-oxidoreductase alpha subunit
MFTISVNGIPYEVDAPSDTPILWVLRDYLELTGTKYGCGLGVCGSCTILLDGKAIRSCNFPVAEVKGKPIITIEGVAVENQSLQKAWQDLNVPQCGYCQPGQLVSALALLLETPVPTDDDIDKAMSGNICRCGTYVRIRKAIHKAASKEAEQ